MGAASLTPTAKQKQWMGSSPVVVNGLVILSCDQSTGSYVMAVDARTGAMRWKTPRPVTIGSQIAFVAYFLGRRMAYTYEVVELVPGDAVLYPGHQYSVASSATMDITREMNFVFRPKTAEQWMTMFGNDGF